VRKPEEETSEPRSPKKERGDTHETYALAKGGREHIQDVDDWDETT
jgi:hypothetical protein